MQRIVVHRRHLVVALVGIIGVAAVVAAVATRSSGPQPEYTVSNIPLGTMAYMSPLQIARTLVPDPEGPDWCWEEVTTHWEEGNELQTLEHGLPADGEIPEEVLALVEERSRIQGSTPGLQAIQERRILFAWVTEHGALVLDVRHVTGGGSDEERWEVWDSGPIYRC